MRMSCIAHTATLFVVIIHQTHTHIIRDDVAKRVKERKILLNIKLLYSIIEFKVGGRKSFLQIQLKIEFSIFTSLQHVHLPAVQPLRLASDSPSHRYTPWNVSFINIEFLVVLRWVRGLLPVFSAAPHPRVMLYSSREIMKWIKWINSNIFNPFLNNYLHFEINYLNLAKIFLFLIRKWQFYSTVWLILSFILANFPTFSPSPSTEFLAH